MGEPERKLCVAAAQIAVTECLDRNRATILAAMHHGGAEGADLVVFPETALTGYSPAIGHGRDPSDWSRICNGLDQVRALAVNLGIWVALGTEAWEHGVWWNRLYVYSESGDVVTHYDKCHLMDGDTPYYRPGRSASVFRMRGIAMGLQICYDARFPEGYRELLHQGVEVILQGFYGEGSGRWKVPVLAGHVRSRAAETGCFVVAANVSGSEQIMVSQIVDPLGLVMTQAELDREQIILADLDLERVKLSEIRRNYLERHRVE